MAVVFTVLMVMAGIYALFKWPIPTLAVLGVLIVIGKSGENKNDGTAPTTAPPPAKPKAPSSPIKPQAQPTAAVRRCEGRDYETRLLRARTESFKIITMQGEAKAAADILSKASGNVYHVTMTSCECEDFKKGHSPCKHMIYFALHTGRYAQMERPIPRYGYSRTNREGKTVPIYWDYASQPTGVGYTNLYPYSVTGKLEGVSEKTGKPTSRKKTVTVNAISDTDAVAAAQELGLVPPFKVEIMDIVPSEGQYGYLHGAEIPYPYLANAADVGALLTRYEDENDHQCPRYLFNMATKYRVRVSHFQEPESVITCIWDGVPDERKPAMFCYAVYCQETGHPFGHAPIESDAPEFAGFVPTKKQLEYITFDNGTEFAAAEGLERSCVNKRLPRTKVYFCHPYSSWERGTNENTNGMIRRRFPKGTNFAAVTNAQIAQAENWINNYPRKILGYKSSEIVFRECLRELGIAA